jgi:hypothetical protein
MVENVIYLLIYICLLVGCIYLVQWVLGQLNISIPEMVMKILWIIVVLVVILLCWRAFAPFLGGGGRLFPHG